VGPDEALNRHPTFIPFLTHFDPLCSATPTTSAMTSATSASSLEIEEGAAAWEEKRISFYGADVTQVNIAVPRGVFKGVDETAGHPPCGRATPETAVRPFQGWLDRRA
jgi:hypothetical protein